MTKIKNRMIALVALLALAASAAAAATNSPQNLSLTEKKIRKELVTLPRYNVFDNLEFQVRGNTVILSGQVTRPTTRKDAERRVAKIEGIDRVVNNIEVLPLSSFDDSIRIRTYRAVFRTANLYRYAQGTNPSIHIVVNRGHVTLEGVVATKGDSNLAYLAASQVSGAFSVTNNLRVER
ncbi:MAG: BON domain-containing protein [Blastocatellia bacterium]|nr:BON domain-containing protein [Blastocatellia bacterium]